jgi:hypothetical protein
MWSSVLYIGLVMATDPIRLGFVLVLVTRRRPMANLLAFWLGGMVAGGVLATAVLVVARDITLAAIHTAIAAFTQVRSALAILEGGRLHITFGVIVLMIAANMVARGRARARVPVGVGSGPGPELPGARPGLIARMGARTQNILTSGGFVWPAFVVGLTSSAPPIESVAALTIIMASGATLGVQFSAFIVFILLVLTVIEIPLLGYVAAPEKTEAMMLRLQHWLRVYGRKITLAMVLVMGTGNVIEGIASL